jgi:hypothetical protein
MSISAKRRRKIVWSTGDTDAILIDDIGNPV